MIQRLTFLMNTYIHKLKGRKTFGIFILLCFIFANVSAKEISVKRNSVKTTFLSWFTGSCKLSYERAVHSNQIMEFTAGYIGFGIDGHDNNPKGYTVRYAHKFMLFGNEIQPLNGLYLRPELIYSRFNYDQKSSRERKTSDMKSMIFSFGYQYVIRQFVIDAFCGGGYAWGKECDTHYQHGFVLWDYFDTYNKNIALTFGIKLGVCF